MTVAHMYERLHTYLGLTATCVNGWRDDGAPHYDSHGDDTCVDDACGVHGAGCAAAKAAQQHNGSDDGSDGDDDGDGIGRSGDSTDGGDSGGDAAVAASTCKRVEHGWMVRMDGQLQEMRGARVFDLAAAHRSSLLWYFIWGRRQCRKEPAVTCHRHASDSG